MSLYRQAAAALGAALVLGFGNGAHAAEQLVSTQTEDVSGLPGQLVLPSIRFDLTPAYKLISMDFEFTYDGSKLSFDEAASQVVFNGVTQSLSAFLSFLSGNGSFLKHYAVDAGSGLSFGDYSFAAFDELAVTGPFIVRPAFTLAPSVQVGEQTVVSFSGELADQGATFSGDAFSAELTVTAVPEPGTWALLSSGMLMLAWAARRRG